MFFITFRQKCLKTVWVVSGARLWCRCHGWWLVAGVMAGAGAMAGGWWLGRWLVRCVADGWVWWDLHALCGTFLFACCCTCIGCNTCSLLAKHILWLKSVAVCSCLSRELHSRAPELWRCHRLQSQNQQAKKNDVAAQVTLTWARKYIPRTVQNGTAYVKRTSIIQSWQKQYLWHRKKDMWCNTLKELLCT